MVCLCQEENIVIKSTPAFLKMLQFVGLSIAITAVCMKRKKQVQTGMKI